MNYHYSFTIAIFVIVIAIPLVIVFFGFLNSQCKTKYSLTLRPGNCYFYMNQKLIPIHKVKIYKSKNCFEDIPSLNNTIYVKERDLFNVPSDIMEGKIVKTFSKKGLQHDLIKSMKKCTSVVIDYGAGKSVIVEKII